MSDGDSLTWDDAKERSDLFKRYWYHRKAGKIMKEITGSSSLYFRNDKKFFSIYAMFSAIREELQDLKKRITALENQSSDNDLEKRVKALEDKLPKTRTEKIRYDLVNTDKKQKEIAERYGVSEEYVSKVKREAGIQ